MRQLTKDEISEFMKRLAAITNNAHLQSIVAAEQRFAGQAHRFKGMVAASDAFRSFVADTVAEANGPWGQFERPVLHTWVLDRLAHNFHWLCAAEQQAFAGYPYPAFSEVRNIFDSAVITSAVIQGFSTHGDADGTTPGEPIDPDKVRKKRTAAERAINSRMTGASSGLTPATVEMLKDVDRMFDWETHGHRLSATQAADWLRGQGPLRFTPHFEENSFAPFMNRYLETLWMVHRLLPFTRPNTAPLSAEWQAKWTIINEFLHACVGTLVSHTGKPIGEAMEEFVVAKFPFDASSTLPS